MRLIFANIVILITIALAPRSGAGVATVIGLTILLMMWVGWRKVGAGIGWRVTYIIGGALIAASFATARLLGDASRIALQLGFVLIATSILLPMVLPYLRVARSRGRQLPALHGAAPPPATHLWTVVIALVLLLLHNIDGAVWHKEPNGMMFLPILLVIAVATVITYPRIGIRARSAVTGVLGVLAVIHATREHVVHFFTGNVEPIDYSGIGLFLGALLLVYVADRNTAVPVARRRQETTVRIPSPTTSNR